MQIKEERLASFIELYKKEFGVTLTRTQAHEKATQLLQYVLMCIRPLAKLDEERTIRGSNTNE